MNNAMLRNMSLNEHLDEMHNSPDTMLRMLAEKLTEVYDLIDKIEKHDIDLSLVVRDYDNFNMKLDDFLQTDYWQMWDERNRDDMGLSPPGTPRRKRYERIMEAAADGAEGSTHREVIEDWIECLDQRDADLEFGPFTVQRLMMEAENTLSWFEEREEADEIIG